MYYCILTEIGRQKYAAAAAGGPAVVLVALAVGDGGGVEVIPVESQAALVNEVWRGPLYRCYVPQSHPDRAVIEAMVPAGQGGWIIREVGVFDADDDMIAVGNLPATTKPAPESGSEKDLYVRVTVEVANALQVVQQVDPSVIFITIDDLNAHAQRTDNPHQVTAAQVGAETPEGAQAKVDLHAEDNENPHEVTAAQAGAETPEGAQAKVDAHATNYNNPHFVTAAQVGARTWDLVASGQVTVAAGDPGFGHASGVLLMGHGQHRHYSLSIYGIAYGGSVREHCYCNQAPSTFGFDELYVGRDQSQSVTWAYEVYRRY